MSAYQQPGYPVAYGAPVYAQPNLVPQNSPGQAPPMQLSPAGQQLAQQVGAGQFPFFNRWEVVGQVFSTNPQDPGFQWINGQQGKEGHLEITVKIRRSWGGQHPGVSQSKVKVIAYGQLGQAIMNQIRPGTIIRAVGEGKVSCFQKKQGPQAGQWTTSVQVQLRNNPGGEVPFEVLGFLPVVDEAPPRQNNYGGGQQAQYPQQQAQYPMPGQGQPAYPQAQQPYQQAAQPSYQQAPAPAPVYQQAAQQPVYQQPIQQPYQQAPQAQPYQQAPQGQPAYQPAAQQPQYQQPSQVPQQPYQQAAAPMAPIPGTPPAQVNVAGQPQGTFMPPPGAPMQAAPGSFQQPQPR